MVGLYQFGKLRFAGPFEDNTGGAAVIEVENEEEALVVASNDPAVIDGVFVYELHPWLLIPWERSVSAGQK